MDPTQCYLEMFDAMREGDLSIARERAVALRDWLDSGGFYPPIYSETEVQCYLSSVLRQTAGIRVTSGRNV
jgi:hypothetical protein